jgi:cytochrome c oxidase subunit IV
MRLMNEDKKLNSTVLFATWIILVSLTIGSSWLSDSTEITASLATKLTLLAALLKGHLIAGIFMEMRRGPIVWAVVMSGFLIAQSILLITILP